MCNLARCENFFSSARRIRATLFFFTLYIQHHVNAHSTSPTGKIRYSSGWKFNVDIFLIVMLVWFSDIRWIITSNIMDRIIFFRFFLSTFKLHHHNTNKDCTNWLNWFQNVWKSRILCIESDRCSLTQEFLWDC